MTRVFIAVGSNLGDRRSNLEEAGRLLASSPGIQFVRSSRVHETEPVGGPKQGRYLNAVWEISTQLPAADLLGRLLAIEERLGRVRTVPNAPRTIDLDILFYGNEHIRLPGIEIPHPRLHERLFVLEPLAELVPAWVHPVLQRTVKQMLEECL